MNDYFNNTSSINDVIDLNFTADNGTTSRHQGILVSESTARAFYSEYSNKLLTSTHKSILLAFYIVIFVLGTLINTMLIVTIRRLRNPRSFSNRSMLLLRVGCDLALVWFGVPYTAYTAISANWVLGNVACKLCAFTINFIVALNNFLLVAICLNRSIAISRSEQRPLTMQLGSPRARLPCRVKFLLLIVFGLAFSIALPMGLVTRVVPWISLKEFSEFPYLAPNLCRESWNQEARLAYDIVVIVVIYLVPLLLICLSQHVVTVRLLRSQRILIHMGRQHTMAWIRRRQHLTRLCVLMAALFAVSWSPNHICNLLIRILEIPSSDLLEALFDFAYCIALSNAVTGPLLLIATTSNYQRYLIKLIRARLVPCCCCCCCSTNVIGNDDNGGAEVGSRRIGGRKANRIDPGRQSMMMMTTTGNGRSSIFLTTTIPPKSLLPTQQVPTRGEGAFNRKVEDSND